MRATLLEVGFAVVTTTLGYTAMGPSAFRRPVRHAPPWHRRFGRAPAGRLGLRTAASNRRLTPMGLALAVLAMALGLLLHHPVPALPLSAAVFLAPGWLNRRQHTTRSREILSELGDAVEYLELYFAAGATVPDAIAGTAAFLVGPLAGELRRVLARAALLQDGSRALDELAQRLSDPDLTAVARRLSSAWRLRAPGPDTFADFGDTLRHIRETHIAARTKTLPVAYVAIAGWMIFALVAIIAVPVGTTFLHSLSSF